MRSLRLVAAVLALALVAAACSDDAEENGEATNGEVTTTTRSVSTPSTTQPRVTTPTTEPPEATTETTAPEPPELPETTTTPPPSVSVGYSPAPSDVECLGGSADNELLVEFDAFPNPSDISKIRTYLLVDDGWPPRFNEEFSVGQVDTTRDGGSRWAAPVRRVPANVPVELYVSSFDQLGRESGWNKVEGLYTAAGAPCGAAADVVLPPTTCTAGCDEEEGEPGA